MKNPSKGTIAKSIACFLLTAGTAHAVPTIENGTVSIAPGHWLQVQDATSYASVCEASTSCSVAPGVYTVIDHTTGERFNGITVGATAQTSMAENTEPTVESQNVSNPVSSITVTGNTISWPDDGWYQIQDAQTYQTICEGGLTCDVQPGSYIVINHHSGSVALSRLPNKRMVVVVL